jgi:predicted nucleic acid-binding protein
LKLSYLDASTWIKRYYKEQGSPWIQSIFTEGQLLACADIGVVEVLATLSRKQKARQISTPQFERKRAEVLNDWEQFIQVHLSGEVLNKSLELTVELALKGANSIHLASVIILKENLSDTDELVFFTSDYELLKACESLDVTALNPMDFDP